jgi:hypothetical protein
LCEECFPAAVDAVCVALDVFLAPVELDFVLLLGFRVVGLAVVASAVDGFFAGASPVELCPALAAGTEAQASISAQTALIRACRIPASSVNANPFHSSVRAFCKSKSPTDAGTVIILD